MSKNQQFLGGVGDLQSALPFVVRANCRADVSLREGKVHVLQNGLDRKMFAGQHILEVIPALERCERIEVMHRKVLTLYGTRLRQYFQCFCRPANLIQPCSQRGERFVG